MERMLRIPTPDQEQQPVNPLAAASEEVNTTPHLRLDLSKMKETVDNLFKVQQELAARKAAFKLTIAGLERDAKDLEMTLEEYARKTQTPVIAGTEVVARFVPTTARKVNPLKLLQYLKRIGKAASFFDYISVTLKSVTSHFGDRVLEAEGVITSETDDYGTMKLEKK